jgi:hypothetical protein
MNIRDPLTIQSLRAMNPSNLKVHVQRAIEQSSNENIVNVKIVSSNQLKSGDLSVKTASSSEVEFQAATHNLYLFHLRCRRMAAQTP